MIETRTLWQRCEALGQFEDYKDDHLEMYFEDERWIIKHDGHPITFIYEDITKGSPWLASAILSHIEAHHEAREIAERSTVTLQNVRQKWNEALDAQERRIPELLPDVTYFANAPQEPEPTLEKRRSLFDHLVNLGDCYKGDGITIFIDSVPKAQVIVGGHSVATQYGPKHGYAFVGSVEFGEVCKLVGLAESPKPTEPTQEQLKAVWEHVTHLTGEQAESFGFQYAVIGLTPSPRFELKIETVQSSLDPWLVTIVHTADGEFTFISTYSFAGTCSRLGCFDVARGLVTESPNQFVSIPVVTFEEVATAFSALAKAMKQVSDLYTPER